MLRPECDLLQREQLNFINVTFTANPGNITETQSVPSPPQNCEEGTVLCQP